MWFLVVQCIIISMKKIGHNQEGATFELLGIVPLQTHRGQAQLMPATAAFWGVPGAGRRGFGCGEALVWTFNQTAAVPNIWMPKTNHDPKSQTSAGVAFNSNSRAISPPVRPFRQLSGSVHEGHLTSVHQNT